MTAGEENAQRQVNDDAVQHQRVGFVAPAGADGAGDRRRDAAAHGAGRQHLHQHEAAGKPAPCRQARRGRAGRRNRSRSIRSRPAPASPGCSARRAAARSTRSGPCSNKSVREGAGARSLVAAPWIGMSAEIAIVLTRYSLLARAAPAYPARPCRQPETPAGACRRRRPGGETMRGLGDGVAGDAVDEDRIGGFAGRLIDQQNALAFRRKMLVAPGQERDQHRPKIAAAPRRHVLVARRMLAIAAALQQPRFDQSIEPARQACWARCRGFAETDRNACSREARRA